MPVTINAPHDFTTLTGDTAIEFAAIEDSKVPESLLAAQVQWASSWLNAGKCVAVLALKTESLQRLLSSWTKGKEFLVAEIVVKKFSSLDFNDLPFKADRLIVLDAHVAPKEVFQVSCGERVCAGHKADPATPWGVWAAGGPSRVAKPVASMPWAVVPPMPADAAGRLLRLEDRPLLAPPLLPFIRKRLYVRTDKGDAFLSRTQSAMAAAQRSQGTPIVPLIPSFLQRRYLATKRLALAQGKPARFLLLKYRRGGFTTIEQAQSYFLAATRARSMVVTLAHTSESTKRIFRMVNTFHELDPEAPPLLNDASASLEFAHNKSLFFVGTAGGRGFGRGDGLQRVHGSEVAKWCEGNLDRVSELMAGLTEACSQGDMVLETTANGNEWFCQKYKEAKLGQNDWTPIFLPWFEDPGNTVADFTWEILGSLDDREKEMITRYGLTPGQVGFRRTKKRELGKLFPQEYPEDDESCFLTSGIPFFDTESVVLLQSALGLTTEKRKHLAGGYEVRWEEPQPGVEYVLGADCSEGIPGCDLNGCAILRKDTGAQVAVVHGLFNPRELAAHIGRMSKAYNDALIGVERENHGHAVISNLIGMGLGRPHYKGGQLYYCNEQRSTEETDREARAGWSTNGVTRPIMLDDLAEWFEADGAAQRIRHKEFLAECLTFRKQGSGRWDHDAGSHDDTIFMWGIANQMRRYRKRKLGIIITGS